MKTKRSILAVACMILFASGCGSSAQENILGKWEAGEKGMTIKAEFAKDGKAKITMLGQTVQGTYKLNGDELEWTLNGRTTKSKAKVTAKELELSTEGQTIKYKKV
jgi:uncharacterized protein (TIGR03066 family)